MSPTTEAALAAVRGFPRSRGDEPLVVGQTLAATEFSPLTRG